ncbi:MAG: DHH family phosphoesterase [Caldicoprobacterales bacterium]|jgi:phosphoesterase RecJ-like protein|nr:bifunctional oligoribonuclease/PAP phosphatase NrnA [Clostridiales bacterium]
MTIKAALHLIENSHRIALIAHVQPDGDAIGSCLALAETLKETGRIIDIYCQDEIPVFLHFLKGAVNIKKKNQDISTYDLGIAIDCSDEERMGTCIDIFKSAKNTMNIDHHISNTYFAMLNIVDHKAAATGEIVYKILRLLDNKKIIRKPVAEALYTAISADTGGFRYRNTTAESYRIAAELVECGIDVEYITDKLYKTNSIERIRLLEKALGSLTLYNNNQIAIISITQKDLAVTGAKEYEIENMVNYAKDIVGVKIGILMKEANDGSVRVSFRSKDEIDVSRLAEQYGGGGHKAAAGTTIRMSMERARDAILESAIELLREQI